MTSSTVYNDFTNYFRFCRPVSSGQYEQHLGDIYKKGSNLIISNGDYQHESEVSTSWRAWSLQGRGSVRRPQVGARVGGRGEVVFLVLPFFFFGRASLFLTGTQGLVCLYEVKKEAIFGPICRNLCLEFVSDTLP